MMERRVLLALALSILVLLVYQSVFVPSAVPPEERPGAGAPTVPDAAGALPDPGATRGTSPSAATRLLAGGAQAPAVAPSPEIVSTVVDTTERETVVDSELVGAAFSNRGAVLASWRMKRQVDPETGMPIDLVPGDLPETEDAPFTLLFEDSELTARAREALFRPSTDRLVLAGSPATLTFDYEDSSGFRIRKEFRFDPSANGYVVRLGVDATLAGARLAPAIAWGPALGGIESSSSGIAYRSGPRGLVVGRLLEGGALTEADVWRQEAGDVAARPIYDGQ